MVDFCIENDIILQPVVAIPCSVALKVLLAAQSNTAESRSWAPTRIPVFGQTPQSTLRARKILCGQNVTNMVICQLKTIACNLPLQAHTKLLSYLLALVWPDIYLEIILWSRTDPWGIVLLKASTFVPITIRRVFVCIVSPQDRPGFQIIPWWISEIHRAYYGAPQSF